MMQRTLKALNDMIAARLRAGRGAFRAVAWSVVATVGAGAAPTQACPLALVLALDVSSSVDAQEYRLQMDGLRAAFRDQDVVDTILGHGGMMVTAYEWSGRNQQVMIVDWTWLNDTASIHAFADRLGAAPRRFSRFPTALGYALGHAAIQFTRLPRQCSRMVVDVSADGVNNEGFPPESAYRAFDYSQITVNGLVIAGADPDPVSYFVERVIRGPGAFVEVASDFQDYANAMKRKLIKEVRGNAFAYLQTKGPFASTYRQFLRDDAP